MKLIDVLRHLNNEYEIRFLLTAYLENLRTRRVCERLPEGVGVLPLQGAQDIEQRFAQLIAAALYSEGHASGAAQTAVAGEATEIFGAAVTRLHALQCSEAPASNPYPAVMHFAGAGRKQEYVTSGR